MRATAIFIKADSGDCYHYIFEGELSKDEALDKAELECHEEREYWWFWSVVTL